MNSLSRQIVSTGLFALDMIVSPKGELVSSGLGGSAGNVLAILARLGWSSVPVVSLADDGAGQRLINEFEDLHADFRYVRIAQANTTPVIYQHQLENSPPGETRCFSFSCPACGQKHSPKASFLSDEVADVIVSNTSADILYFDRPTKLGVELAERYRGTRTLVVFEPSTIGDDHDLFCRALRSAHIVKYADDRLSDLAHFPMNEVAVEICTMGSAGLRYRAPSLNQEWVHLNALQAPWVVDTSGAGDWCSAGMLYHLFDEDSSFDIHSLDYNRLSRALRFGQTLSALNCMTLGARGLAKSFSPKKITATGHYLKNVLLKAETMQASLPDPSWLAYELLRNPPNKNARISSRFNGLDIVCCGGLF